jgi:predicted aspartyl protease
VDEAAINVAWRAAWAATIAITLLCEHTAYGRHSQNAGNSNIASTATLDGLLTAHRDTELAAALPRFSNLKPEQHDYFAGALALRRNRLDEAKKLLERAVNTRDPDLRGQERDTALTHEQVFSALMMLGNLYMRAYHYGAAADMYDLIDRTYASHLEDGGQSIRRRRHVNVLLKDVPVQTASIAGESQVARNVEGYPIQIGERTVRAVLDTGASLSQISATTAAAWGVTPLPGTPAWVTGFGGRSYKAQMGVIRKLIIGSATVFNAVVVIAPDEQLTIGEIHAQLRPSLGFPIAAALGRITFSRDGTLTIHSQENAAAGKAPLWLGDESLLVALNARAGGDPQPFLLDTGAASSFLTENYVQEHRSEFPNPPADQARLAGGGGIREIPAYTAHHLPLWFGATPVYLDGQHILTATQGGEAENYFGVIGMDVLQKFSSYTIDLDRMEFSFSM